MSLTHWLIIGHAVWMWCLVYWLNLQQHARYNLFSHWTQTSVSEWMQDSMHALKEVESRLDDIDGVNAKLREIRWATNK
jgi:hypothetical protein